MKAATAAGNNMAKVPDRREQAALHVVRSSGFDKFDELWRPGLASGPTRFAAGATPPLDGERRSTRARSGPANRHAAVHQGRRSGHETGGVGGEEGGRASDFFGLGDPFEGVEPRYEVEGCGCVGNAAAHRGVCAATNKGVGADLLRTEFGCD